MLEILKLILKLNTLKIRESESPKSILNNKGKFLIKLKAF